MPLTLEERRLLRREILALAWPVVLQNLFRTMMFTVDTFMIGRLGPEALSAMGIVGPVSYLLVSVLGALSVGTVATVARAWGAQDPARQELEAATGLTLAFLAGVPLTAAGVLLLPAMVGLFEMPDAPAVGEMARGYLRIGGAMFLLFCLELSASGILRAAGRTAFPMAVSIGANAVNVFLNWVFIYGHLGAPAMGVPGAALATALAYGAQTAATLAYLGMSGSPIRLRGASFRKVTRDSLGRLARVTLPAAVEPLVLQSGWLLYNKAITLLGVVPMAAHRAAIAVESLTFMPGYGFAVAGAALVGQRLGAGRPEAADAACRESARLAFYVMSGIGLVFLFAPAPLVGLFLPGPRAGEAVALGALCLALAAPEQPFMALSLALGGALRGAGDTRSPILVAVAGVWLVRVPLAWALAFPAGLGLVGIWLTMIADWAVRAAAFGLLWRAGRWKAIKL
jgi:putative MATE family efflux protein